ncbi:MAG TPA: hypothetical protein VNQ73_05480 [Ilumatobacter sp.]|nr:hypothetical protein [Ilumatobacter sp.]
MQLFIVFMFGVLCCSAWELRASRHIRTRYIVLACAVLAVGFSSLRVV